jgi:hypothetical protein
MDVDWSVEAAVDDPVVVVPWHDLSADSTPNGSKAISYVDLKADAAAIDRIAEAKVWPELRQVLVSLNATESALCSVKCDAWALGEEERQLDFGPVAFGFGMYVDVLPISKNIFSSLTAQRSLVETWVSVLRRLQHEDGHAEFVIRPASWEGEAGFAITIYMFGYGAKEAHARKHWAETAMMVCEVIATSAANLP